MKAEQIVLASRPNGLPTKENFRFEEIDLPDLESGQVLLNSLYISVDPYMRGRMNDAKSYIPPFELNKPIVGGIVAVVVESKSSKFQKGDKVLGSMLSWSTLLVANEDVLQKIEAGIPESYYLGILGMPGLTAYFGTIDICKPQAGETFVVSGAAGAVGSVVGQIAKIKGCRVVGIAGSDDKVKLLKEKFGFDEVINYKTEDVFAAIQKACPNGVDCYYDNVGGEITDAVVANFNKYARMALCGHISSYNDTEVSIGPRPWANILKTSTLVKGFLVFDYQAHFSEGTVQLSKWLQEGKLKYTETILEGFEELPNALIGLFKGTNTGKMVVKI